MVQMSGKRPVRTALKPDPGNVQMVRSVSRNQKCVTHVVFVMTDLMRRGRLVETGPALKVGGNVLTMFSVSETRMFVMVPDMIVALIDQMRQLRPARTGPALKTNGSVMISHGASPTRKCVMRTRLAGMGQMSRTQHVRTGTAQHPDPGNVLMIPNAFLTLGYVMEGRFVVTDQMSGRKSVATGTVVKGGGNVLMVCSVSTSLGFVMDPYMVVAMIDQMNGLTCANPALKMSGNVQTSYSASLAPRYVTETVTVKMDRTR